MIVGLEGKIIYKEPNCVHINVQGVVYEVFISLQTFAQLQEKAYLFTSHIVREDAQLLYGFSSQAEKTLFERLIKINGVGPKVAIAICSTFSPNQFATVINANDIKSLKKVPGIGPKSAGRILVELNGFDTELLKENANQTNQAYQEAFAALETLGFNKDQISQVLNQCNAEETATLVKEALKLLKTL